MKRKLDELSDEELMALYQQGDELAFNGLYARHSDRVYGYLRKRLRNPQAANDVFQAAFLKLHRSRDQFNPSFVFAPWLFAVVRTALLDWLKDGRNKDVFSKFDQEQVSNLSFEEPSLSRDDLSSLPEPQRSAVEMRYFEDLSFDEIAAKLETTSGNVRQIVSRGVRRLKSFLVKGSAE